MSLRWVWWNTGSTRAGSWSRVHAMRAGARETICQKPLAQGTDHQAVEFTGTAEDRDRLACRLCRTLVRKRGVL